MTRQRLRQFNSIMAEIMEEEGRRERLGVYSLFGDDHAVIDRYRGELSDIMDWIGQIPDSLTRRAFRMRYIDGLPWIAVSCKLGYSSESGARQLCARYLKQAAG